MAFCSSSGRRVAWVCLIFVNLTFCGRASNGETRKSGAAAGQDPTQAVGQLDGASGAEDPNRIADEGGSGTASSVSAKEASTSENLPALGHCRVRGLSGGQPRRGGIMRRALFNFC